MLLKTPPLFFLRKLALVSLVLSSPQAFLSMVSRGSVLGKAVLGLGFFFLSLALSFVSSTPPLIYLIDNL